MDLRRCALFALILTACQLENREGPDPLRTTLKGKAYLENRVGAAAVEAFTVVVELEPESAAAWRNLARAHLLPRDSENADLADQPLERAAELDPESAATSYLAGLADVYRSRFDDARLHFEEAVRLDPHTTALRFQLAGAYQVTKDYDKARRELHETLRLDPLHTGAVYKLLGYARKNGDKKEVERLNREQVRLHGLLGEGERKAETWERCVHTWAEVPAARLKPDVPALAVRFTEATGESFPPAAAGALAAARAAAVVDVGEDGRPALFVAGSGGWSVLAPGGGIASFPAAGLATTGLGVAVGNFHDDVPGEEIYDPARHGANDVLLLSPDGARLLQGTPAGTWDDVTARAGLAGLGGRRARWVDYEHDGDLDLAVASRSGLQLWQNGGDGRFEEVAAAVGLGGVGPAVDVAAADLDGDVAVDLVVARGEEPTLVFHNRRAGRFAPRGDPPGAWPPARRVLLDDLDHDGYPEAVLAGGDGVVIVPGRGSERRRLDAAGLDLAAAALFDFDNDGWRDLVAGGRGGRLRLWRNAGDGSWTDATTAAELAGVELPAIAGILAADADGDGDTDLLVTTADGLRFLRNDGGNVHGQLKVRLRGTKTNPNGFGALLELRRGDLRIQRFVSELPVEIGIGRREPLDVVRVVWTNGIVDNTLDVAAGALDLVEKNVTAGSCPFLYAWDGEGYSFVTDVLGNSPLGLSIARGVPLDADPDELVRLPALAARGGRYRLVVTEEMREVLYLDEARLVAVDHAPGVEVHPTDKLRPAPFPPSELWALGSLRPPLSTASDDGVERTAALAELDGVHAPPGVPLPPPLRGMTRPLAIVLDFGPLDAGRPWVLALTGWLQYGDASTNVAASQGAAAVVPPLLEAETSSMAGRASGATGSFEELDVVVGMPAGKSKTILVPLDGKLPAGTRRLRLTTSFEIRWDRIALGERLPPEASSEHVAAPVTAELFERGFSEIRTRTPGHPTTPDYAAVSPAPPWRTALQGWVTRYGDVLELVRERDERLALVGAGDALELAFDAATLPPVPPGRVRTFFFYSVGWDKDGDLNVIAGDTVEPLPVAAPGDWQARWNTRWVPWDRFSSPR